jgi:hypothetical protein
MPRDDPNPPHDDAARDDGQARVDPESTIDIPTTPPLVAKPTSLWTGVPSGAAAFEPEAGRGDPTLHGSWPPAPHHHGFDGKWHGNTEPPPPPPSWPGQPPPPPRGPRRLRKSRTALAAGAAATVAALAVAAVVVTGPGSTVSGTAVPAPGETETPPPQRLPFIAVEDLNGLLLDDDTLSSIVGLTMRAIGDAYTRENLHWGDPVDKPECQGVLSESARSAYEDSDWIAVRRSMHIDGVEGKSLSQAVVNFPSTSSAEEFVQEQALRWKECEGQVVTYVGDDPMGVLIQSVDVIDGTVTAVAVPEANPTVGCDRALRAVSNVVVDVQACTRPANNADRIAELIAEKVRG